MQAVFKTIFDILYLSFLKLVGYFSKKIEISLCRKFKENKFKNIAKYALINSKFYKEKFEKNGINLNNINKVSIQNFPVIKKAEFIENIDKIYTQEELNSTDIQNFIYGDSPDKLLFKDKFMCFTTSGSLGLKLPILIACKDFLTFIISMSYYGSMPVKALLGLKTKVVILGLIEGRSAGVTLVKNLSKKIYTTKEISIILPIEKIIAELNDYMPEQVISYPGVFLSLVEPKINEKLKISPNKIILSGELLSDENHARIQQAFSCEVVNSYGLSECLAVGIKNSAGKNYKLFNNMCLVEILDEHDKQVAVGKLGRVVITNFYNFSQPFIRYDTGDYAEYIEDKYGNMIFKGVSGRNYKPIIFSNNLGKKEEIFHWSFYTLVFYSEGIRKSQLVVGEDCFKVYLVGDAESFATCRSKFIKLIEDLKFEKSVKLQVENVNDILPEINGKIPFIKFDKNLVV